MNNARRDELRKRIFELRRVCPPEAEDLFIDGLSTMAEVCTRILDEGHDEELTELTAEIVANCERLARLRFKKGAAGRGKWRRIRQRVENRQRQPHPANRRR